MKTVLRNSYAPQLGDYCDTIVIDKETYKQYLFDADGVWTLITGDTSEAIKEAIKQANAYTDEVSSNKVDKEDGKELSSNDFTDADKDKLDGIESGAQENKIDTISRNGAPIPIVDKNVDIAVPTKVSELDNDTGYITNEVNSLTNYYSKDETTTLITNEANDRISADGDLQSQIDAITSASDVVDIVGTYEELQAYDTSTLSDKDIIKVLSDSTHNEAMSYYRWNGDSFLYIGSQGPFYTKSETDAAFVPQTRTINGKGLNSDVVLTAADVNALPDSTAIPTVNDAMLTIQKNGTTVATFTANSSQNATADISVPTKVGDLTNDLNFVSNTSYATASTGGVVKIGSGLEITNGILSTTGGGVADAIEWDNVLNKPTFSTVATSGSYNDLIDRPTPQTVNDATLTIQRNSANVGTFTANASSDKTIDITVPTTVAELSDASAYVTQSNLATQLANKQDTLTAGDHINIADNIIKAVDYVHSDDPVPTSQVTPVVTNDMIADGTITADKLAAGATLKLTLSTSDIGEGSALAANTLYGVYQ